MLAAVGLACSGGPAELGLPASVPRFAPPDEAEVQEALDRLPPAPPIVSGVPTGFLRGDVSINARGDAEYTLPLPVPAGRGALTPPVSLHYSSGRGQGLMGVGWTVQTGSGRISRCARTLETDGYARAVKFDSEDRLCLDGQRLVLVSGADYWAPGAEYRTQIDNVSKIVLQQQPSGGLAFEEHRKDGQIRRYGKSAHCNGCGEVILGVDALEEQWLLSEVSDRDGNTIEYAYNHTLNTRGGEATNGDETEAFRPATIWYTSHRPSGTGPSRRIDFHYQNRLDRTQGWKSGARRTSNWLLERVEVRATHDVDANPNVAPVQTYNLTYGRPEPSFRSRLDSVELCDAGGVCQEPVRFSYTNGNRGFETGIALSGSVPTPDTEWLYDSAVPYVLDVNGDGRSDLMYPNDGAWQVRIADSTFGNDPSASSPYLDEITTSHPTSHEIVRGMPIDFNVDGLDDLLLFEDGPSQGRGEGEATWRILLSEGDGSFTLHDTETPYPDHNGVEEPHPATSYVGAGDNEPKYGMYASNHTTTVDWNTDGFPDLITYSLSEPGGWNIRFGDGQTFGDLVLFPFGPSAPLTQRPSPYDVMVPAPVDVDGDGVPELLLSNEQHNGQLVARYNGGAITYEQLWLGLDPIVSPLRLADLNGDGLRDFLYQEATSPHYFGWSFNDARDGHAWHAPTRDTASGPNGAISELVARALVLDEDRDGLNDLVVPFDSNGYYAVGRTKKGADYTTELGLDLNSDGENDSYFAWEDLPGLPFDRIGTCVGAATDATPSSQDGMYPRPRVVDFDGDGVPDLVQIECGQFVAYPGAGERDGLLASVWEEGIENIPHPSTYSIEYSSGANPTVYTRATDCQFPQICKTPRKALVSAIEEDTGSTSEPLRTEYSYKDWRYDLATRRSLGFRSYKMYQPEFDTSVVSSFLNHERDATTGRYPLAGAAESSVRTVHLDKDTRVVDTRLYTYYVESTWPGVQLIFPKSSWAETVEERHPATDIVVSFRSEINDPPTWYGTSPRTEVTTHTATHTIEREIADNPADWVVGAVANVRTTSVSLAGEVVERELSRVLDMSTGHADAIIDNPALAAARVTTTLTRDAFGNLERVETADNVGSVRSIDLRYDDQHIFPVYLRNPVGHEYSRTPDEVWGVPVVSADANGLISTQQIDTFGRVVKQTFPSGQEVNYERAALGGATGTIRSLRTVSPGHADRTTLIGRRGQSLSSLQTGRLGNVLETAFVYDDRGYVSKVSEPTAQGQTPSLWTSFHYDIAGRVNSIDRPNGTTEAYEYSGRSTTFFDARGFSSTRTLDASGNLVSAEDEAGSETTYAYGPVGELRGVTDPAGNVTSISYDVLGRRTALLDKDLGERRWEYNGFGEVEREWSAAHQWRTYTFDDLGRTIAINDIDGLTTFDFDIYGFKGALGRSESPDGVEVLSTRDVQTGLPRTTVLRLPGESPLTVSAAYDSFGRLSELEYPTANGSAPAVSYGYDDFGNVTSIDDSVSGASIWKLTSATPLGEIEKELFGNGVETDYSYTTEGRRLTAIQTRRSGSSGFDIQDLHLAYDEIGNVRSRFDQLQDGGAGVAEIFAYDPLSQLDASHLCKSVPGLSPGAILPTDADPGCDAAVKFTYDAIGNIVDRTDRGTYQYGGAQPHAVTNINGVAYQYDANGNLAATPDSSIEYTAFDLPWSYKNLSTGEEVLLEYDAGGQRARKLTSTLDSVYLGRLYRRDDVPGAPFHHPNATHRYTVYAGARPVAELQRTATGDRFTYNHTDHLGSVVARTDDGSSGTVQVERLSYDAFGSSRDPDWLAQSSAPMAPSENFGFTGHELDDEIGLVNMRGRLYSPHMGRFTTPDPFVQAPFSTQSLNRYSYVWNNPASLVDPSGFAAEEGDLDPDDGYEYQSGRCDDECGFNDHYVESERGDSGPGVLQREESPGSSWADSSEESDITGDDERDDERDGSERVNGGSGQTPLSYDLLVQDVASREPGAGAAVLGTIAANWLIYDALPTAREWSELAAARVSGFIFARRRPAGPSKGSGGGERTSGGKADRAQFEKMKAELAQQELAAAEPVGSALKGSGPFSPRTFGRRLDLSHAAATFARDMVSRGRHFTIRGRDGVYRDLTQVTGVVNGVAGIFEFIVGPRGLTHQRFIAGGRITGYPNQRP